MHHVVLGCMQVKAYFHIGITCYQLQMSAEAIEAFEETERLEQVMLSAANKNDG